MCYIFFCYISLCKNCCYLWKKQQAFPPWNFCPISFLNAHTHSKNQPWWLSGLNGKVTWLGGPLEYPTFWAINRLFQSGFETTIKRKTIWPPDTNLPCAYQTIPVFRWLLYMTLKLKPRRHKRCNYSIKTFDNLANVFVRKKWEKFETFS